MMQVTLELPEDLASLFGQDARSVSRSLLEALSIEGLRAGKLSVPQAKRLLGFSSKLDMDGFLKSHDIMLPLEIEDVLRDAETSSRFRAR